MSVKIEGRPFATQYDKRPRFHTDAGSREANTYEIEIDKKTGHKKLICTGTKDIWTDIQSYKDECDIGQIIARAAAGDLNALNQRKGFYGDITETPKDLFEAQNSILKLERGFNELPSEIREKFDNSRERFVKEFGTDEWYEKMGFVKEEIKTQIPDEVQITPEATEEKIQNVLTPKGGKTE